MSVQLKPPFSDRRRIELHFAWQSEGWDIFEAEGSIQNQNGRRLFQLQRLDEADVFEDDEAAWSHVATKAWLGSQLHIDAMTFLKDCSPDEFAELILRLPCPAALSPGQHAYEEDVRRNPLHHDQTPRRVWSSLERAIQQNWEGNPIPRVY